MTQVVAAVISRDDRVLVCQRSPEKRHAGLWEFPGGKCEPGESLADTARRELSEELGAKVVAVGQEEFSVRDEASPFIIVFLPVTIEGEPECREHSALRWVTLRELSGLSLPPADRHYVDSRLQQAT